MILELAILDVISNKKALFEQSFAEAQQYIQKIPGYLGHELQRCLEKEDRYILLVRWETLEAHTVNFRQSAEYQKWKQLLHHFYDSFPTVEHYQKVNL